MAVERANTPEELAAIRAMDRKVMRTALLIAAVLAVAYMLAKWGMS
jgi:hypothetical protein